MSLDRLTPFDVVEVWGNPWHGKMMPNGDLHLDNGMVRPGGYWPRSAPGESTLDTTYAQLLVQLPGLPEPENAECDDMIGASWKNWALLAGRHRQYGPFHTLTFGPNTWFYRAPDGTVWQLRLMVDGPIALPTARPAEIRAKRVGVDRANELTLHTVPYEVFDSRAYDQYMGFRADFILLQPLSASADGHTVVLRRAFNDGIYINSGRRPQYVIITTIGGSADVPPTVSAVVDEASQTYILPPERPAHSTGEYHYYDQELLSVWVAPDGEIIRSYIEHNGYSTWQTGRQRLGAGGDVIQVDVCTQGQYTETLVVGDKRIAMGSSEHVDTIMTTSPYLEWVATLRSSTVFDGTTDTNMSQIVVGSHGRFGSVGSCNSSVDGSVISLYARGVNYERYFGTLGQEVQGSVIGAGSAYARCAQHPLTGELTLDAFFF